MKPTFWILGMALVVAGTATALDVPFRDGTVITADSYKVTGSYVMIVLADGSQVAFDVADVEPPVRGRSGNLRPSSGRAC